MLEKEKKLSEKEIRLITLQLLLTVDFMNRKGVVHRDLKPENILLNSKEKRIYDIRIADFGFATKLGPDGTVGKDQSMVCGTPGYIAPETLIGKGFSNKSDVFSVGSIVYSMVTLRNIFPGRSYRGIMV